MSKQDELLEEGKRSFIRIDDLINNSYCTGFIVNNVPYGLVIDYAKREIGYKSSVDNKEWLVKQNFTPLPDKPKSIELIYNIRELEFKLLDMGIINTTVRE